MVTDTVVVNSIWHQKVKTVDLTPFDRNRNGVFKDVEGAGKYLPGKIGCTEAKSRLIFATSFAFWRR